MTREIGMTPADAAIRARTTLEAIREAISSGDLRDLRPSTVDKWVRSRVAATVTPRRPS